MLRAASRAADKADPLAGARMLYNQRKFDAAVNAAERARLIPALADSADLIAARAYLERFRESAASDDLANARDRLRRLNPRRFAPRERLEFIVGLGETLYFDESYGAAADVFESVLDAADACRRDARERVLDWWASALDRDARPRPISNAGSALPADSRAHAATSCARIPAARRRRTGWRRPRAAKAIFRRRGMRRRPAGCARRSRATAARRCAPISIASCSAPSCRSAPGRWRNPPTRCACEWERFKERWKKE